MDSETKDFLIGLLKNAGVEDPEAAFRELQLIAATSFIQGVIEEDLEDKWNDVVWRGVVKGGHE